MILGTEKTAFRKVRFAAGSATVYSFKKGFHPYQPSFLVLRCEIIRIEEVAEKFQVIVQLICSRAPTGV